MMNVTPVNLQPTLEGELVLLRPLRESDWSELFAVACDPLIWEQHPAKNRCQEEVFREFFRKALAEPSAGGGAFAVIDKATGKVIGSTRYHNYDPITSEIEIGWTFLARTHWGGHYNREMKRLMLDHIFKYVHTVYFLVGPGNMRSQKAMERIGAINTGIIQQRDAEGKIVDHVKYVIRRGFETANVEGPTNQEQQK